MNHLTAPPREAVIERADLDRLLDAIGARGFRLIGPRVRDGAVVYDDIASSADLPAGWTDVQEAGTYRLERRNDEALFGYTVGPQSWKQELFPPELRLWNARRLGSGFAVDEPAPRAEKLAFIGVRGCELEAIRVQDRVFMGGTSMDPTYAMRRSSLFVLAVNCGHAGGTCFCASMGTGPGVNDGFDLALTEIVDSNHHYFVVQTGSDAGREILGVVPHRDALDEEIVAATRVVEKTAQSMGREVDTDGIKALLYRNYDHPRWEEVASRCLSCGNCTMVCPTCFCSTVEDVTDLSGEEAGRVRRWDSCFTLDHSYIHGGSVRVSPRSRYRQWMTHKLATWIDQFGTSGCVGCGRCITWCPAAIDITEEVAAIRATDTGPVLAGERIEDGNS